MVRNFGVASETAPLARVLIKRPEAAFVDQAMINANWQKLNYLHCPDFEESRREMDAFSELLTNLGSEVLETDTDATVGPDSIYVHDSSIVTPKGVILASMGKEDRRTEPAAMRSIYQKLGVPVLGEISGSGRIEGGDLVWLDDGTVAIAEGYRSNAEGIRQFRELAGEDAKDVIPVPLVHWNGPSDVLHLMSFISPIAPDIALVYSRLMPVIFRNRLLDMGIKLVEVPDEEYDSMGCNVLAVKPGVCVALEGNPETKRRLEAAGCEVYLYQGHHISAAGCGGPTCLTRPILRSQD